MRKTVNPRSVKLARTLVVLALLLVVDVVVPTATAHHATRAEPSDDATEDAPENDVTANVPELGNPQGVEVPQVPDPEDVQPDTDAIPDTYPTLDEARDDLLRRQQAAVEALNEELRARNLTVDAYAPAVPARALYDGVENGSRVGGIGEWRVLGGHWRPAEDAGHDGSAGFTITRPEGGYGTMDAWLVSPAIDLSAYPVPTGKLPFSEGADVRSGTAGTSTDALLKDQVTLLLAHRYHFVGGKDGGQVMVFTREPMDTERKGSLIAPLPLYGRYSDAALTSLGSAGFTGSRDWNVSAFDLTPWAGRTIWIVFRAATSPEADAGLQPSTGPLPAGWAIDDVEILTPAFAKNLKVYDIIGPTFHADPRDAISRTPPGENVTVGATILNAAGTTSLAYAEIVVDGADEGRIVQRFSQSLRPGETWTPNLTVKAPATEGMEFGVSARAWNPGPAANVTYPDPTQGDNLARASFLASTVRRFGMDVAPAQQILDEGDAQTATVTLENTGNVPLTVSVTLVHNATALNETTGNRTEPRTETLPPQAITLAPGATGDVSWQVDTREHGAHDLDVLAFANGAPSQVGRARFYVHASPPPVFSALGGDPTDDWAAVVSNVPLPPLDDWVWLADTPNERVVRVLKASPLPEAVQRATEFEDLRMSVRYMVYRTQGPTTISIAYPAPTPGQSYTGQDADTAVELWSHVIPGTNTEGYSVEIAQSWRTLDLVVEPSARAGYVDAWRLNGLEVRVRAGIVGSVYLDDLRLTGVPVGRPEAERMEIVRITGGEGVGSSVPLVQSTIYDATGTQIAGTTGPAGVSACVGQQLVVNCWRAVHVDALRERLAQSNWTNETAGLRVGDNAVLWDYDGPNDVEVPSQRLVTPVLELEDASDPVVYLDHAYAFAAIPRDDASTLNYILHQFGFVELQYLRDDGTWSAFVPILPEEDYADVLGRAPGEMTPNGYIEGPLRNPFGGVNVRTGDGFYHPTPCPRDIDTSTCVDEGFINVHHLDGKFRWTQYLPTPMRELSVFRLADQESLAGVDLSNRDIRLGFHVTLGSQETFSKLVEPPTWRIGALRVTPVGVFAIDAAVTNLSIMVPYDWEGMGVPPNETIMVNVTVRNTGRFPEAFSARLSGVGVTEELNFSENASLGVIAPGQEAYAHLEWRVPDGSAGRAFRVTAEAYATSRSVQDENPFNDRMEIGTAGELLAGTRLDGAVEVRAFPITADAGLVRQIPITLYNRGNLPIEGLRVTRTIERLSAGGIEKIEEQTWTLSAPLPADPRGVPLARVAEGATDAQLSFTPSVQGTYFITVQVSRDTEDADADPANDVQRLLVYAVDPLFAEDFEDRPDWETNAPGVWGEGKGFRSRFALEAKNATGNIPPGTDAWVVTPPIPVASARAAYLNFMTRYSLEESYDGVVVEASADGVTWHRVPPSDAFGRPIEYPGSIAGINPLASPDEPGAFTGESAQAGFQIDGWAPVTMNLATVPALSEEVVFQELLAPTPTSDPLLAGSDERIFTAPWMVVDEGDPAGRWEVRNETIDKRVETWWSGFASTAGTKIADLSREFNLTSAPEGSAIVVSWWDRRPGSLQSDWTGVGGEYNASNGSMPLTILHVERGSDGWSRISATLPGNPDLAKNQTIQFRQKSATVTSSSLGWEVRDISVEARPRVGSAIILTGPPLATYTGDESDLEEQKNWTAKNWLRVERKFERPAPWTVAPGEDGMAPEWKLVLDSATRANIDTRLVTPTIDLTATGGGRTLLKLNHSFDLVWSETTSKPDDLSVGKAYQAGVVEIEVFNRTTDRWDPPRQIFADPSGPSRVSGARPRAGEAHDGLPYNQTLADAGDTFQRFPRDVEQEFRVFQTYLRTFAANVSYAFSGDSQGRRTDTFDLTPFVGSTVRIVFHAWSGPADPEGRTRHWTIHGGEIVGTLLSTDDIQLRFRLGTDASVLDGEWAIDAIGVSGVPYEKSVALQITESSTQVGTAEVTTVKGFVRNHGAAARPLVAVGLRIESGEEAVPIEQAVAIDTPSVPTTNGSAHLLVLGPFDLAGAGKEGAMQPFEFQIHAPGTPGSHVVRLELLDGTAGLRSISYAPGSDDAPGRTRRSWPLTVEDERLAAVESVSLDPATPVPGRVTATIHGMNAGTKALELAPVFRWLDPAGQEVAVSTRPAPVDVDIGAPFTFRSPPTLLNATGNHTLEVTFFHDGEAIGDVYRHVVRVGVDETALRVGFEEGMAGWRTISSETPSTWHLAADDARFGTTSMLFGLNDSEYAQGKRATGLSATDMAIGGTLISPVVDLRQAGADATLTFWMRSRMGAQGTLTVNAMRSDALGGADPECAASVPLWPKGLDLNATYAEWVRVDLPLGGVQPCAGFPLIGTRVAFAFNLMNVVEQGWRIDGVSVRGNLPAIDAPAEASLPDSARKEFRITLSHEGLVPRTLHLALDPASKVTAAQAKWFRFEPTTLTLAPGGSATSTLIVEAPSSRIAFPQDLSLVLSATEAGLDMAPTLARLLVSFEPEPRADLVVHASFDGESHRGARLPLEEATPHEIAFVIDNDGSALTAPTTLMARIVNEQGVTVWQTEADVDALIPARAGGEAAIVSASWKPVFGERGNHTLLVRVDPERAQPDYERGNQELELPLVVTRLVRPDLVITPDSLVVSTPEGRVVHETAPGTLVRVSATFRNDGLREARQVTLRIVAGAAVLKEEIVPVLGAGESHTLSANQLAPPETLVYQAIASSPDIELRLDNNQVGRELGIYPPELEITPRTDVIRLAPGRNASVALLVANRGAYPMDLTLSLGGDAAFARLATTRLALAPGEEREVLLDAAPTRVTPAGQYLAVVHAQEASGIQSRRTVPLVVEAVAAADAVVYRASGPPHALRLETDLVNEGNQLLEPRVVLRGGDGKELASATLEAIPPGGTRFAAVEMALPAETAPGALDGVLVLEVEGEALASAPVTLEVEPYSRVIATARPDPQAPDTFLVSLRHEGNVPTSREPVVLGAPSDVKVHAEPAQVHLEPGASAEVRIRVSSESGTPPGLYSLRAAFVEPGTGKVDAAEMAQLSLDVRRPRLEIVSVERDLAEAVKEGDTVTYTARVRNVGDKASGPLPVELYVDGGLVAREEAPALPPGGTASLRLQMEAPEGTHAILLAVDPHGPHGADTPAFVERIEVESSLDVVSGLQRIPLPPAPLLALLAALAALALPPRRGRRRA